LFSIGELSRITGLSVKALRLYHDKGLLVPARIDPSSSYRYYDAEAAEEGRLIRKLRGMEFSLEDIKEILGARDHEDELVDYLEAHKDSICAKLSHYHAIVRSLETVIAYEKEARMIADNATFEVEEKQVENILVAALRYQGSYADCGKAFARIGRRFGRYTCGKPMNLYYDAEYKENDADIESCIPVRKGTDADGIVVRELPGGRCVSLIHKGTYDELGRSYEKIVAYVNEHGLQVQTPSREIYLKGPGMLLRGNPKNYLTELQLLVEE